MGTLVNQAFSVLGHQEGFLCCHVHFFVTSWTVAQQAPLPIGFPRQEYRSGLPFPLPGDLPDLDTGPASPEPPALAGGFFTTGLLGKPFSALGH